MKTYEISYSEFGQRDGRTTCRRVVVGQHAAANGIDAIRGLLAAKGVAAADIESGRALGSIKRLSIAGITFQADRVAS